MDQVPQVPVEQNAPGNKDAWIMKHKKLVLSMAAALVVVVGGVFAATQYVHKAGKPQWQDEQHGLVADKISRSAAVVVTLPESVKLTATEAENAITFEPKVLGTWQSGTKAQELVFTPKDKLELGKYYRVSLKSGEIALQKDFKADEDPKVDAVFPKNDSEASETAEITIEFNRPMVPLSTLDVQLETPVPVTIEPAVAGKFKWATTRTLKFIPEKRLARSTHYIVKVGSGFTSMDGLAVEPMESRFTTRPLRYESDVIHHTGLTLYSEPVAIRFNQPVDLEKTKSLIEVKNNGTQQKVDFDVEYGTRTVYLGSKNKQVEYTDKSVIYVYQSKDNVGRSKFWNNKSSYQVNIKGAVPLEGDIKLEEFRTVGIQIPDVLASVSAQSDRSSLAAPDLFDPKGTLVVNFFEELNKDQTSVKAPGLKSVEYGQQCKLDEDGNEIRVGSDCEKEDNKKQLVLHFNQDQLKPGQAFDVEFSKVVNSKGLQINPETVRTQVRVYPPLQILSAHPGDGEQNGSLTSLVLCTNSPLEEGQPENFYQRFKSNVSVGKWNWDPAYRVPQNSQGMDCSSGQYLTRIRYGLQPETRYELDLSLVDEFGQTISKHISFTSGKVDSMYRSFSSLQKDYNVASTKQTKLTYVTENLEFVDLHVCQVSAETMLSYLYYETRPGTAVAGSQLACQQTWTKRIDLPRNYWTQNYFQVDIKDIVPNPLGYYVLSFSNPELREQVYNNKTGKYELGGPTYYRTFLNITNLAAQEKKVEVYQGQEAERATERKLLKQSQGNLYWVSYIGSLNPAAGAHVDIYERSKKNFVLSDSATANAQGVARAKAYSGDGAAVVSLQGDSTIVQASTDRFQWSSSYSGGEKTYLYTDRPIYRPGQEVYIKGLYRIGYDGEYEIFQDKTASIKVYSSKNEQVFSKDLKISSMGTFDTVFSLPKDAPLGSYRIEALGGYYSFDVEEYVPSAFKLDMRTDKDEYIAGDNFKLNVDANYYFGVPVEGGTVEYSVLAQDYYFDRYRDGYFQFGAGWYYSYEPEYGDNFILRGKAPLDSQGKAEISQNLDFGKFFKDETERNRSKIFVVRATVSNGTGQAVSSEKSFIVHRGEFYLGVNLEKNYFGKNEPNKVLLKTVDTQGKERSVGNISGKINKVTWNYYKRQEVDGGYYWHSERKIETVKEFNASTDGHGNYSLDFSVKDEGEYEVMVESKDGRGNTVTAVQDFYVYGQGVVEVRPLNNESLDLAVENSKVDVGGQGKFVIKSPFAKAKALVAIERGRILDYQIIDIDRSFYDYSFPIKESYVPNIFATVLLLSPDPQVKFGQAQFFVNTNQKAITLEAKPDRNNYLPGQEVTLDVTTKDSSGRPVQAEVSLAVADLSVLALAGNPKKDPVSFFYDGRPLGVTTSSNLKNILTETEIPTGTKGGGGAEPGDLAKKKRGVFKDTAYWNATVQTDSNGKAKVTFKLPDNLTTWQVEGVGITWDTKVGAGYSEFMARKDLMVTPLYPRFAIPGDEFVVGAKVFNQTQNTQSLKVIFESPTLELKDSKEREVRLNAGQTTTVYFKVKSPDGKDTGQHSMTLTAKNAQYEDSVESQFPINRNETYEAVATSFYTTDTTASEYVWLPDNIVPNRGGVTVQSAATLTGIVPDALNYLVQYPYGCTEQMMSKLASIAVAKKFVATKNVSDKFKLPDATLDGQTYTPDDVVRIGLSRIMANQSYDGGFAYYPTMKSDYYLTLHVLDTLEQLRAAGYEINNAAETKAVQYVYQQYLSQNALYDYPDTLILTAYTLGNVPSASNEFNQLLGRIKKFDADKKLLNEDASNLSLVYLALLTNRGQLADLKDKVFTVLENRVVTDGRGAYLGGTSAFWQYYETPVKDTALFVKAESVAKRDYREMDKVLRWIKNSRSKDGAWGSTNNTLAVLDAFAEYLKFKPETQSNFVLEFLQDNTSKGNFTFNNKTVFDTWQQFMPITDFKPGKLSRLQFAKKNLNDKPNGFYYDMSLKYYLPIENIAPRDEGFAVERELYSIDDKAGKTVLTEAKVGQVMRGHLKITVTKPRNFVSVESFIPAGTELVNFNLATEDQSLRYSQNGAPEQNQDVIQSVETEPVVLERPGFFGRIGLWFKGLFNRGGSSTPVTPTVGDLPDEVYSRKLTRAEKLYPENEEYHDDRLMLFNQHLEPGVYEYDYYVRALIPGKFQHLPAVASELYQPENFGRTRGEWFSVVQ